MIKTIDLDDQNFDMIVDHARKAIRKYAPYWTDENAHDPGITLIELFAWLKEMLQFYMDQPTEEIELQFLRLLGMHLDEGEVAEVILQSPSQDDLYKLPLGSKLSKGRFIFETTRNITLETSKILDVAVDFDGERRSVYQLIDNGLTIYPFGPDGKVGSSFYLHLSSPLKVRKMLLFYIKIFEDYEIKRNPIKDLKAFIPFAEIKWYGSKDNENWEPLTISRDDTFNFIQSGLIGIEVPNDDVWLKATLIHSDYDMPPRIIDIYNRVFEVKQKDTLRTPPPTFNSTGLPNQTFELPYEDILFKSLLIEVFEKNEEGEYGWQMWERIPFLAEAKEDTPCFAIDQKSNALLFGDGINGKIPPKGRGVIRISHLERSFFEQGNILLDNLIDENTGHPFKCLTAAMGGEKRSTLGSLKENLRGELSKPQVCVTAGDYEEILRETPGLMIKQVKCLPLYKPGLVDYPKKIAENTVSVFVIPDGAKPQSVLSQAYRKNLEAQMEKHRLITTEVLILDPVYFNIDITCEIGTPFSESQAREDGEKAIREIGPYDFGDVISKSEIYKALSHCDSVSKIHSISLRCSKPISKNKIGDLEIPINGIGIIQSVDLQFIHD